MDLAAHKRRLWAMLAVDGVCVLVAIAMIYGYLKAHEAWMMYGFCGAIAVGFAAQIWMVFEWMRAERQK